jgi:hypothetical protein
VVTTRSPDRFGLFALLASVALLAAGVVVAVLMFTRGWDDSSTAKVDVTMRWRNQPVAGHVEITTPNGDHVRSLSIGPSGSATLALRFGDFRVTGLSRGGLFCGPSTLHADNSPGQGAVLPCHQ